MYLCKVYNIHYQNKMALARLTGPHLSVVLYENMSVDIYPLGGEDEVTGLARMTKKCK